MTEGNRVRIRKDEDWLLKGTLIISHWAPIDWWFVKLDNGDHGWFDVKMMEVIEK